MVTSVVVSALVDVAALGSVERHDVALIDDAEADGSWNVPEYSIHFMNI